MRPELNDALWERYRTGGDPEARTQLLDRYLGLVHHAAHETLKRVSGTVEFDELVSAGTVGLVQALEGFEPGRGLAFSTYAMPRIRGAMLDELRSQDWMPRTVRERARRLGQALAELQHRLGRAPGAAEMAARLGIDVATYWRWLEETGERVMVGLDQQARHGTGDESQLHETIPDLELPDPGAALMREETLAVLREAFQELPAKDRLVLSLYYYEELNLRQIGEVLHITESRVSQIRARALRRLRQRMSLVEEER
jgi:RNA polymerase sigma factor for flagellar operon FliA